MNGEAGSLAPCPDPTEAINAMDKTIGVLGEEVKRLGDAQIASDEKLDHLATTVGSIPIKETRKRGAVKQFTKNLAAELETLRDNREYPFDIAVVSVKDIAALNQYQGISSPQISKALAHMGAKQAGPVMDGHGGRTRVWAVRHLRAFAEADAYEIGRIFRREVFAEQPQDRG